MIRALAVTVLFLVAAGMGLPSGVPAQTPAQGQAVGILFLLAASRSSAPPAPRHQGKSQSPAPRPPMSLKAGLPMRSRSPSR